MEWRLLNIRDHRVDRFGVFGMLFATVPFRYSVFRDSTFRQRAFSLQDLSATAPFVAVPLRDNSSSLQSLFVTQRVDTVDVVAVALNGSEPFALVESHRIGLPRTGLQAKARPAHLAGVLFEESQHCD